MVLADVSWVCKSKNMRSSIFTCKHLEVTEDIDDTVEETEISIVYIDHHILVCLYGFYNIYLFGLFETKID